MSDLWLSRLISIPGSSCFSSQNRGDPRDPRGSLVVTWRREVGLPGPQRQPGAQHGFTSVHRHDVPQRKAVPVPEGKHYPDDTFPFQANLKNKIIGCHFWNMSLFALFSRVRRGNRYRSISYVLRSLMSLAVGLPHPASAHWDGSLHSLSNQQAASTHLNSLSRSPWSAAPLRCCWVMSSSSRRAVYRRPSELNQVEVIRVRLLTRLPPLEEFERRWVGTAAVKELRCWTRCQLRRQIFRYTKLEYPS